MKEDVACRIIDLSSVLCVSVYYFRDYLYAKIFVFQEYIFQQATFIEVYHPVDGVLLTS